MDVVIETEGEPLPLRIEQRVAVTLPEGRRVFAVYKKVEVFDATAYSRVVHKIYLKSTP